MVEGPLFGKKGPQRIPNNIRGRHGLEDSACQPCPACQNPSWRLSCPCITTCATLPASYVPLEEFYLEKAS